MRHTDGACSRRFIGSVDEMSTGDDRVGWLRGGDTINDVIFKLSEGHPAAASVLAELLQDRVSGLFACMDIDDMDLRGPEIWFAYHEMCSGNLAEFRGRLAAHDENLLRSDLAAGGSLLEDGQCDLPELTPPPTRLPRQRRSPR
jgi:hypothetical protein